MEKDAIFIFQRVWPWERLYLHPSSPFPDMRRCTLYPSSLFSAVILLLFSSTETYNNKLFNSRHDFLAVFHGQFEAHETSEQWEGPYGRERLVKL